MKKPDRHQIEEEMQQGITATQDEINGYIDSLEQIKSNLNAYQSKKNRYSLNHTSQDVVLTVAVDGLLDTLKSIDYTKLTLTDIIRISENANEVISSTNRFFSIHK